MWSACKSFLPRHAYIVILTFDTCSQLECIALQKHGVPRSMRNKHTEKKESGEVDLLMLKTFFLLHCGIIVTEYGMPNYERCCPEDVDPGWFVEEFGNIVGRKGFRKPKEGEVIKPARMNGTGTPYPTKRRSVKGFIAAFYEQIVPHTSRFIVKASYDRSKPFFSPAERPGPPVPGAQSMEAYKALETTVEEALRKRRMPAFSEAATLGPRYIHALQEYVLDPNPVNMERIMALLDEEKQRLDMNAALFRDSACDIAFRVLKKLPQSRKRTGTSTQSTRKKPISFQNATNSVQRDATPIPEDDDRVPSFRPSASQAEFEQAVCKSQALWMNISEEDARDARMRRVHQVVRAVSVAHFGASESVGLELERLKWQLVYYDYGSDIYCSFSPWRGCDFGRGFVNASSDTDLQNQRNMMLRQIHMRKIISLLWSGQQRSH